MRKGSVKALTLLSIVFGLGSMGSHCNPVIHRGSGNAHIPAGRATSSGEPPVSAVIKPCTTSGDCTGGPVPCTVDAYSYCYCETLGPKGGCATNAGQCVWTIDLTRQECVCVPGSTQACSTGGIRTCNGTGTDWTICG